MKEDELNSVWEEILVEESLEDETESIEQMQLDLEEDFKRDFKYIGIRNLFVVEFDEVLGPKLKYFVERDDILNKMLLNPAFVAEITIFAKHAEEVLLKDGRKLVINEVILNNKQNYIFVEIDKGYMSPKPLKFTKYLHEALIKKGELNERTLKKAILEALVLIQRSTFGRLI